MKLTFCTILVFLLCFFTSRASGFNLQKLPLFVNSKMDEFPVSIQKGKLVFIKKEKNTFVPYEFNLYSFDDCKVLPIIKEYYKLSGSFLSFSERNHSKYVFFAGKSKDKKDLDIFCYKINENRKTTAISFPFNSNKFESHPQISLDGTIFVFSAENTENNAGTDIYLCTFENDNFSQPVPINEVNTSLIEITPFIDEQGNLFFARFDTTNYNIYKAERIGNNLWSKPKRLPYPINTDFNELAPVVHNGKIYFASDREKNDFDIYSANLCLPVFLEINLTESPNLFSSYDKIVLYDSLGNIINEKYLETSNSLIFNIEPNRTYRAKIFNECTNESYFDRIFTTSCLDTSILKYTLTFEISNNLTKEKNIPFFLTGYYKPITKYNLLQLKKLFDYNLIGNDDSTSYIEYPSKFYFDISDKIEEAIKEITDHINYFAKVSNLGCLPANKKLKIEIIGYADPRQLSQRSRFFEETIIDRDLNFYLERGASLNNDLLSKLRAYFTAKELKQNITSKFGSDFVRNSIIWEIKGGGTILDDEDYLLLRKVTIKVYFEQEDFLN